MSTVITLISEQPALASLFNTTIWNWPEPGSGALTYLHAAHNPP